MHPLFHFISLMSRLFYNAPTNKEVGDIALKQLGARLDVYDQILGKQKYVAGDVSCF